MPRAPRKNARIDAFVLEALGFEGARENPPHDTSVLEACLPYPSLQKEAPPRFAEKVAGVDKPAPGESLSAWQARTGRGAR